MKILIIALTLCSPLLAKDFTFNKDTGKAVPGYVAQLKMIKGEVFRVHEGKLLPAKPGTRFYKDDTIVTQERSFAKLEVVYDTIINLGSNSELNFEKFKFTDKTDRQIVYSFIKGQIRGIIKNKAKDGDLMIKSPLAVMAVRGTEILANHQSIKGPKALEITEFALLSGRAEITDKKNVKHDLLKSDRIILVEDKKAQSAFEKLKLSDDDFKNLNAVETDELKDFKPYMPFFSPEAITATSSLYSMLQNAPISTPEEEMLVEKNATQKKDWRYNLQKLNEKLKENQKKK